MRKKTRNKREREKEREREVVCSLHGTGSMGLARRVFGPRECEPRRIGRGLALWTWWSSPPSFLSLSLSLSLPSLSSPLASCSPFRPGLPALPLRSLPLAIVGRARVRTRLVIKTRVYWSWSFHTACVSRPLSLILLLCFLLLLHLASSTSFLDLISRGPNSIPRDERPRKMQKSCERRKDGGTSSLLVAPRAILERIMRTNANSRLVGHERATNVYLSRSGTDVHTYARHTLDNRGRCIRETRVPTHDTHVLLDDLALGFSPFDSLARPRPPPPTTPRCFPLFSPLLSTFSSACLSHEFPAT